MSLASTEYSLEPVDLDGVDEGVGCHQLSREIISKQIEWHELDARAAAIEPNEERGWFRVWGVVLEVQKALRIDHNVAFLKGREVYFVIWGNDAGG